MTIYLVCSDLLHIYLYGSIFRSPISQLSQQGCALTAARKYLRFAYQKFAFLVKITDRGRIFDRYFSKIMVDFIIP